MERTEFVGYNVETGGSAVNQLARNYQKLTAADQSNETGKRCSQGKADTVGLPMSKRAANFSRRETVRMCYGIDLISSVNFPRQRKKNSRAWSANRTFPSLLSFSSFPANNTPSRNKNCKFPQLPCLTMFLAPRDRTK